MGDLNFSITEDNLNAIFPFYLFINEDMSISGFGSGIGKLLPVLRVNDRFSGHFAIKKPVMPEISTAALIACIGKVVLLESRNKGFILRGQLLKVADGFLFAGSLVIDNMEQVAELQLSTENFALHDQVPDLLNIVRSYQMNADKLKDLLAEKTAKTKKEATPEIMVEQSKRSTNKEGVVFVRPDGSIFWCNDAYLALTGYTHEELFSKDAREIGRASIDERDMQKLIEYFEKGEPFDVVLKRRRKDKTFFWTKTKGQPIFNEEGVLTQYLVTVEDLTPEREKDERLSLLSMIAEKNINPVLVCDSEGRIEWVSSNFIKTTGYTRAEAIGRRPGELLEGPETDPQTSMHIKSQALRGLPVSAEILNYTKAGQKRWIKMHGQALHNSEGEVLKYYAIREDITERKLMEAQREELLKVLAKSNTELEDYAQIVSHDLKSPLNSIHSLISWIKEDNAGAFNDTTAKYFSMIEDKLEKMHDLIQGILTYSKIDKVDITKETIDTHEVVKDIISMIYVPDNITIRVKDRLPVMRADKFRMQQLFQNLISNAVNYNDKAEGLIEISCEEHPEYCVFCVKDNGQGIAKEHQEKIYRKFSSFSDSEKSSGLGLSIVQKIVENYKGQIWLESEPGKGAAFFIKLYK